MSFSYFEGYSSLLHKGESRQNKVISTLANGSDTIVDHSSHHPEVEGSSPAATVGTREGESGKEKTCINTKCGINAQMLFLKYSESTLQR
jgi:hypothetical protein